MGKQNVSGVVDFFNSTGGYGFIETPAVNEEVFFHMEDIGGPHLTEGTEVEFDIEEADKGPRAMNVRRSSTSEPNQTATGTVDFFNSTGGYGFIETPNVNEEVFFHMEDVGGPDLTEGTKVECVVEQAAKGPRAIEVQRVSTTSSDSGQNTDTTGNTEIYDENTVGQESGSDTQIYDSSNTGATETQLSYCPSCGEDLTEIDEPAFCPSCGTEL